MTKPKAMGNKYIVTDTHTGYMYMVGTVRMITEYMKVSEAVVRMALYRGTKIDGKYTIKPL